MTKYREIVRLSGLGLSQTNITLSCNASKTTVNKVLKAARERNLSWPLDPKLTDPVLGKLLFPESKAKPSTSKRMPAEQVEVDWAGDPAHIIDPDTGEILDAHIFVGVMTYASTHT